MNYSSKYNYGVMLKVLQLIHTLQILSNFIVFTFTLSGEEMQDSPALLQRVTMGYIWHSEEYWLSPRVNQGTPLPPSLHHWNMAWDVCADVSLTGPEPATLGFRHLHGTWSPRLQVQASPWVSRAQIWTAYPRPSPSTETVSIWTRKILKIK